MDPSLFLDNFMYHLNNNLPQEWLVSKSEQITCHGRTTLIRVDAESKPKVGRKQICFIQIKRGEIRIFAPNILSVKVQKVAKNIKPLNYQLFSQGYCLTLTECSLLCETCSEAQSLFLATQ